VLVPVAPGEADVIEAQRDRDLEAGPAAEETAALMAEVQREGLSP
jgi:hypothetical protein